MCLLRGRRNNTVGYSPNSDEGFRTYQEDTRRSKHHEGEHKGVFRQILSPLVAPEALVHPEMLCYVTHESPYPFSSIHCLAVFLGSAEVPFRAPRATALPLVIF